METTLRSIHVRSYDGTSEADVDVLEPVSVEHALPDWLEDLQLAVRDADGNPVEWSLQDSKGTMIPPSMVVSNLQSDETYTLAPDLTPAGS